MRSSPAAVTIQTSGMAVNYITRTSLVESAFMELFRERLSLAALASAKSAPVRAASDEHISTISGLARNGTEITESSAMDEPLSGGPRGLELESDLSAITEPQRRRLLGHGSIRVGLSSVDEPTMSMTGGRPEKSEPASSGRVRDKHTGYSSMNPLPPRVVPALPDLTKLFPSGSRSATDTPGGANQTDCVLATSIPRQDKIGTSTTPTPGWQRRVSLWVEEQAQLWGTTYSEDPRAQCVRPRT